MPRITPGRIGSRRFLVGVAVVGWVLVASLVAEPLAQAAGCNANLRADLKRKERREDGAQLYAFSVNLETRAACARVTYALDVEERLPDGTRRTLRKSQFAKVHLGELTRRVEHRVARDVLLERWSFEVIDCTPCDQSE